MERLLFPVAQDEGGERLDRFLARKTGMARTQIQRLIEQGAVRVDGKNRNKNHRLSPGEGVEVEVPEPVEVEPVPQSIPVEIIYRDRDLAVISKPAGLVVHPAAGHRDGTLVNALLHSLDGLSGIGGVMRPGIVHRLDRDTSGLMVVALNDASHLRLQEMVRSRELERLYLALVHGVPATRLGAIDAPVGRDPGDRKKMAVTAGGSKTARTSFKVLRDFGDAALLEVRLETGRTHQIRVHLAFIGHPVAGDPVYGVTGSLERRLGLRRQFLHAYSLAFPHPTTGQAMCFEIPLPADLGRALQKLERRRG